MESPIPMAPTPDPHLDAEDMTCKGCGDILEEGKAFELAGNRWHIDCFRCTTCAQPLDSDANLLLLGDGSLLCNGCTYNCAACGNKIEDLAILTGDQAFCSTCFKCRNCKRDIENLRYARTSQGIFCMDCHNSLMNKRRKKLKQQIPDPPLRMHSHGSGGTMDKSLPALPPPITERALTQRNLSQEGSGAESFKSARDRSPQPQVSATPSVHDPYGGYGSSVPQQMQLPYAPANTSQQVGEMANDDDDFFIPVAFDPSPAPFPPPPRARDHVRPANDALLHQQAQALSGRSDYFSESNNARSASIERDPSKPRRSPHIAYQEKGRKASMDNALEVLRRRKENGSATTLAVSQASTPPVVGGFERSRTQPILAPSAKFSEQPADQELLTNKPFRKTPSPKASERSQASPTFQTQFPPFDRDLTNRTPDLPQFSNQQGFTSNPPGAPIGMPYIDRPERGDSLAKMSPKQPIPRKEVPSFGSDSTPNFHHERKLSTPKPFQKMDSSPHVGGKPISKPLDTKVARSIADAAIPARSPYRDMPPSQLDKSTEFTAPRQPPPPPPPVAARERYRPNESASSFEQFDPSKDSQTTLPSYSTSDLALVDDEFGRIPTNDMQQPDGSGLLRKMSKAVKHGRSQSDKVSVGTPSRVKGSRSGSVDIGSPATTSTPDSKEDTGALRARLRVANQKIAELEVENNLLQQKVDGNVDIRQVNTELREKRSTLAFLDSQQEMVSRELEIMTEQIKKVKDTGEPLNLEQLKNEVLREFAASLQKLKDRTSHQIEDLMHKKTDLVSEINNLIQMKDKGFQEYDNLSSRNAQLAEHNNQLVQNIQEMCKQGKVPMQALSGLGIYTGDGFRPGSEMTNLSGDTEVEPATIQTSRVVDVRKGQVKKFNWKKEGKSFTKNVRQGFKGAFGAEKSSASLREEQNLSEGIAYSNTQPGEAPITGALPYNSSRSATDQKREPWTFLSQKERDGARSKAGGRDGNGATTPSPEGLFGTDLSVRCEHERRLVPAIVTRCIEEVDLRGIDAEGIYRKSGSSLQVKSIQDKFELNSLTADIADPDLDIHAVTGCLKQYLRKLPIPLITYDVYDAMLEAGALAAAPETRETVGVAALRSAVAALPRSHRDTLEFLVFHLARVIEGEAENLMTPLNLSVVFAPTIMRPQAIEREMTDMQASRAVVQALLECHLAVFAGAEEDAAGDIGAAGDGGTGLMEDGTGAAVAGAGTGTGTGGVGVNGAGSDNGGVSIVPAPPPARNGSALGHVHGHAPAHGNSNSNGTMNLNGAAMAGSLEGR